MTARILIIDDEPGLQNSLIELLQQEGYQADSAGSGEAALVALESEGYDLALLDLRMPGLDGVGVMHEIRKLHPEIRIIILTGYGSLESAIEALRSGAQDYILKPFSAEDILTSISRALTNSKTRARKEILIEQLTASLDQLKDVEGIRGPVLPARRIVSLPREIMVDLERREIWRDSQLVHLTPTESSLMGSFLENKGRVMSHQELVFLVQGITVTEEEAPEILRPMVSRLRKKMAVFSGLDEWISNVRGTGYLFDPS